MAGPCYFLHGLDSSSQGAKARFFRAHFPTVVTPDFSGDLAERMAHLTELLAGQQNIVLIGSSFGGLLAAIFAIEQPKRISRLILLAPALNFPPFRQWQNRRSAAPTTLFIGRRDSVTPPATVIPAAERVFTRLDLHLVDDDHLLGHHFPKINWPELLGAG